MIAQLALPLAKSTPAVIVAQVLGAHRGIENGISAKALALACLITERAVREAITELRMQGVGVASTPETGYFLATSAAELEPTLQFIRSRALTSLMLEARMRNVALPDLIGQLRLTT